MEENKVKEIINNVNFAKRDRQIIKNYEQVMKMFDKLVEFGVAERGKMVLSKNSSVIKFDFS